jgi:hypothetical protein
LLDVDESAGANDLLIAAQTLALEYTLVTDNEREFARPPNEHEVMRPYLTKSPSSVLQGRGASNVP